MPQCNIPKANTSNKSFKVAVIGAGPAGLISAKFALAEGYGVDILEQSNVIGGTWVYTDDSGFGADGQPVHSAMYKGLRTNVPKELMECSDFFYPKEMKESYITPDDVLQFFEDYIKKFSLRQHIQFNTRVIEVKPIENERWQVKTRNLANEKETYSDYDAVMVCNGHYNYGAIPNYPGKESFEGIQIHSHDYRSHEPFINKKCLVVGYGLSGQDLARILSNVADKIIVSHRLKKRAYLPEQIIEKPGILKFNKNGVEFEDGSTEEVDAVVYCTGYNYYFPFLTKECGITVEEGKWVKPLYKQVVNIEHPTMAFIGLLGILAVVPMFDLQARFFMATLNGHFPLPSREAMLEDLKNERERKAKRGSPVRHMHFIGNMENQAEYFQDVAKTAKIKPVPPVIDTIFGHVVKERMTTGLKNSLFVILDDKNFKQIML